MLQQLLIFEQTTHTLNYPLRSPTEFLPANSRCNLFPPAPTCPPVQWGSMRHRARKARLTSRKCPSYTNHSRLTHHNTGRKQSAFPFLSLPPELRNIIYEYVFSNTFVELNVHTGNLRDPFLYHSCYELSSTCCEDYIGEFQDAFGLLCSCRQVNMEARALPIALSTFTILNGRDLRAWNATYSSLVAAIQTLRIYTTNASTMLVGRTVAEFVGHMHLLSGLKKIEIVDYESDFADHALVESSKAALESDMKVVVGQELKVTFLDGYFWKDMVVSTECTERATFTGPQIDVLAS